MNRNISSNEIIERENSQILKEIDLNKLTISRLPSKLSRDNDYESIGSSENGEQQVPRINSKLDLKQLVTESNSTIITTPKRPSAPPPLPPRLVGCSLPDASILPTSQSPHCLLKPKTSFNKKYDAPILPQIKIDDLKKCPPPLPQQPPPPLPNLKNKIAPKIPNEFDKRFNFQPITFIANLPNTFDLPKDRKYPSHVQVMN